MQLRQLLYMSTIGSGIMEAMADLEAALASALNLPPLQPGGDERIREPVLLAIESIKDKEDGKAAGNAHGWYVAHG